MLIFIRYNGVNKEVIYGVLVFLGNNLIILIGERNIYLNIFLIRVIMWFRLFVF